MPAGAMDPWQRLRAVEDADVGGAQVPRQSCRWFAGLRLTLTLGLGIGIGTGIGIGLGSALRGSQHLGISAAEVQRKDSVESADAEEVTWNNKSFFWRNAKASGYYSLVTVTTSGVEPRKTKNLIKHYYNEWYCEKALSHLGSSPYVLAVPARASLYQAQPGSDKDSHAFLEIAILEALEKAGVQSTVTIQSVGIAYTGLDKGGAGTPLYSREGACEAYHVQAGAAGSLDLPLNKDVDLADCADGVVEAEEHSCHVYNERPTYKAKNGKDGNAYLYYDDTNRWRVGWSKIGQLDPKNDMVCATYEDTAPDLCTWEVGGRWDTLRVICTQPPS